MLTKFIKTSDKEIAEKLRKCGMYEVLDQDEYFVFVNTGLHTLTEDEKKKVIYTNALNV